MKYALHDTQRRNTAQSHLTCSSCQRHGGGGLYLSHTIDENLNIVDVRLLCAPCRARMRYTTFYSGRGEMVSA
jgi:hypothetical protein